MTALDIERAPSHGDRARVLSEFITRETAERVLGCEKSTIYELMRNGTLPFSKVGARRYIRRADLFHLIESGFNAPALTRDRGVEE